MKGKFSTQEVAGVAHVHRDTLLRWLREGRIPEPSRDRNGWRIFSPKEVNVVVRYAEGDQRDTPSMIREAPVKDYASPVTKLRELNWDFADASTGYLTHSLHPYPAKFIPQIPNALIQELSSVGDTVLDPFCGSGTSLVEALLLKRNAVGVDANPLACLISEAKTTRLTQSDIEELRQLEAQTSELMNREGYRNLPLFPELVRTVKPTVRPTFDGIDFWFEEHVIEELTILKGMCQSLKNEGARQVALMAFSSIIVAVSRQDSDTRYVRREKSIQPGDSFQKFTKALGQATARAIEFTELTDPHFSCRVVHANALDEPEVGLVDLVVCSPPYPNAYSYHLYHRTRMLWLDMDQPTFKKVEIGSHRKYSDKGKNAANDSTFYSELRQILIWLHRTIRTGGYACFVIGDSILQGRVIRNDRLLSKVALSAGYHIEANLSRRLQDAKKSFNPSIGKIKDEHILILRKVGTQR